MADCQAVTDAAVAEDAACAPVQGRSRGRGDRSPSCFYGTLPRCSLTRTYVLDILLLLFPVLDYVISRERHSDGFPHVHFFVRLTVCMPIKDFAEVLRSHIESGALNVLTCKNVARVISYITKEDTEPLYNVSLSQLHFNVQLHKWLLSTRRLSFNDFPIRDSFVVRHKYCYKYIKEAFIDFHGRLRLGCPMYCRESYEGWYNDVVSWYNDWFLNKWVAKKRQLYLYGHSNIGKSTCINKVLNGMRIFYPDYGLFAFGDLNDNYDIIVFEEFDSSLYNMGIVKRLIEGADVRISVKSSLGRVIHWRKPVVFVSNELPGHDQSFLNRLKVVEAVGEFWREVRVTLVKPEVPGEEEAADVIEISSDEAEDDTETPPSNSLSCSAAEIFAEDFEEDF